MVTPSTQHSTALPNRRLRNTSIVVAERSALNAWRWTQGLQVAWKKQQYRKDGINENNRGSESIFSCNFTCYSVKDTRSAGFGPANRHQGCRPTRMRIIFTNFTRSTLAPASYLRLYQLIFWHSDRDFDFVFSSSTTAEVGLEQTLRCSSISTCYSLTKRSYVSIATSSSSLEALRWMVPVILLITEQYVCNWTRFQFPSGVSALLLKSVLSSFVIIRRQNRKKNAGFRAFVNSNPDVRRRHDLSKNLTTDALETLDWLQALGQNILMYLADSAELIRFQSQRRVQRGNIRSKRQEGGTCVRSTDVN